MIEFIIPCAGNRGLKWNYAIDRIQEKKTPLYCKTEFFYLS